MYFIIIALILSRYCHQQCWVRECVCLLCVNGCVCSYTVPIVCTLTCSILRDRSLLKMTEKDWGELVYPFPPPYHITQLSHTPPHPPSCPPPPPPPPPSCPLSSSPPTLWVLSTHPPPPPPHSSLSHFPSSTDLVHAVHLKGAFMVTRAALPYMRKQNYGRYIVQSCSHVNKRWRRKKEASKVKQTTKQSNITHPRQSLFQRKMSCLGWDSNPLHSTL